MFINPIKAGHHRQYTSSLPGGGDEQPIGASERANDGANDRAGQKYSAPFYRSSPACKNHKESGADRGLDGERARLLHTHRKSAGQKVKIWVDKSTYLIWQSQITLGGAISDEDIDDAVIACHRRRWRHQLAAYGNWKWPRRRSSSTRQPMTKISGVITSTTKTLEVNPTLSASDFIYPVPEGVRLIPLPASEAVPAATSSYASATRLRRCKTPASTTSARLTRRNRSGPWKRAKRMVPRSQPQDIAPYLSWQKNARLSGRRQIHHRQSRREADLLGSRP